MPFEESETITLNLPAGKLKQCYISSRSRRYLISLNGINLSTFISNTNAHTTGKTRSWKQLFHCFHGVEKRLVVKRPRQVEPSLPTSPTANQVLAAAASAVATLEADVNANSTTSSDTESLPSVEPTNLSEMEPSKSEAGNKRKCTTFYSGGAGERKALDARLKAAKRIVKSISDTLLEARREVADAEACLKAARKRWEVIDVDDDESISSIAGISSSYCRK